METRRSFGLASPQDGRRFHQGATLLPIANDF
jgi:hypothetical protein